MPAAQMVFAVCRAWPAGAGGHEKRVWMQAARAAQRRLSGWTSRLS